MHGFASEGQFVRTAACAIPHCTFFWIARHTADVCSIARGTNQLVSVLASNCPGHRDATRARRTGSPLLRPARCA